VGAVGFGISYMPHSLASGTACKRESAIGSVLVPE
jgi:hypothetical protein